MNIINLLTDNPVAVTTFVSAALTLAIAFGLKLSQDQFNAILGAVAAILVLGVTAHKVTVPKTPSATATSASIQAPQPPPPAPPTP